MTGSLNRKLQEPKFKAKFEHRYRFFQLEVQIRNALEDKGWTYCELAKATGTYPQNVWRDLKNGGLQKASLERVARYAEALGLHAHHFLLTPRQEKKSSASTSKSARSLSRVFVPHLVSITFNRYT